MSGADRAPSAPDQVNAVANLIFSEIAHGEQDHRDWLWNKSADVAKKIVALLARDAEVAALKERVKELEEGVISTASPRRNFCRLCGFEWAKSATAQHADSCLLKKGTQP